MASKTISVLLVEDELTYAQAVKEWLSASCSFHVLHAKNLSDARGLLSNHTFDVALLDLTLPDSAGLATFTEFHVVAPKVPVIVITGIADETLALLAVRQGAQDYLVKGQLDGRALQRSVRYATERRASIDTLRDALADVKRAHEELKATQLKLVQAEKLEAVSTFAAGVAHEVRNPLQTILMGLEYLGRHLPGADQTTHGVVNDMIHAVKRAEGIVRGLADFAQHTKRDVRDENLSAILKQAVTAVEPEANAHPILLSRELAEGLPRVTVDFRSLKHVFINLLMRLVRDLQPEGGRIVARTFTSAVDGPLVLNGKTFRNFQVGDSVVWAEIEVFPNRSAEDNRNAAPSHVIGFGITVLKKIVELYGGAFEGMHPQDTGGSRYVVVFKAATTPAPQAPGSAAVPRG